MAAFVSYVKKYRQLKGLTQEELGNLVGARRETIVRLEAARYNPSLELAARIAYVLDANLEDLFEFDFGHR